MTCPSLVSLHLTHIETGLLSIPNKKAKMQAAKAAVRLGVGIAKSIATSSVDKNVMEGVKELAGLARDETRRRLAATTFTPLALHTQAAVELRVMLRGDEVSVADGLLLIEQMQQTIFHSAAVRWETKASFIVMITDAVVGSIGHPLASLHVDTLKHLCLTKESLVGLMAHGDASADERGDPAKTALVLICKWGEALLAADSLERWLQDGFTIMKDELLGAGTS